MNLTISGHHLEVTPALRDYVSTKMERVTRTVYLTGRTVANLPRRPVVDRKLPAQLTGE